MARALALAPVFLLSLACGGDDGGSSDPEGFARPVVLAEHPLELSNPQTEPVTWPIWGGAFTLGEAVRIQAVLTGGAPEAGIALAGPGDPETRRAVTLAWTGEAWSLRESEGATLVQDVPLSAPAAATFVLELAPSGAVTATSGEARATLTPAGPLGGGDEATGLYVWLAPGAALTIDALAVSQPLPADPTPGTPLRELAAARGLTIGTAVDIWPPLHDPGFESLLGRQFGAAAPTELYWATTRGEDGDYFFLPADLTVNYARVHDQALTGMFLVWDFELPAWVTDLAETGDAGALGAVFDEHITTTVARYRGEMDAWVVVNEAIWGPDETGDAAELAQTIWLDVLGEEYIERAFQVARAADPDAILLYNETGAEALGEKSDFLHAMATDLLARDVPLDGIGLQFHIDAASPPDLADVRANLERFGALGLEVHITELDVSLANLPGSEADKLETQAQLYVGVLDACLAVPECRAYTVFGFSDRYAWDELGDASPLLFDADYRPKPAFHAIQAALE